MAVDGTNSMVEDWTTVHSMIVFWIINTIDLRLRSTIPYYEDASLLWEYLKGRFSVAVGVRIQQLKSSLRDCKQDKNKTIVHYYGRLKKNFGMTFTITNPFRVVNVAKCSCDLGAKLAHQHESGHLFQFFMGLDMKYGVVRSTLLFMDPLPTLNRAYQIVIQEEQLEDDQTSTFKYIRTN